MIWSKTHIHNREEWDSSCKKYAVIEMKFRNDETEYWCYVNNVCKNRKSVTPEEAREWCENEAGKQ